jgi:siroheme synthase (precorrin-2 oxidase/ferrochelatase)
LESEHLILANFPFPIKEEDQSVLVCGFGAVVSNRLHWLTGLGPNVRLIPDDI